MMQRKRLGSNRKGVGGFFVDLPIIILVLAVIAVLLTSIYHLYVPVKEEKDKMELNDRCIQLNKKIQNYNEILADERKGEFSVKKLEKINETDVESYLGASDDYEYNIYFEELEGDFDRSFGSVLPGKNNESGSTVKTYTVPVSLVHRNDISSIGSLEVKVWRS